MYRFTAYKLPFELVILSHSNKASILSNYLVSECRTGFGDVGGLCRLCEKGYYKDTVSNTQCTKCPDGKTTSGEGKTKSTDCSKALINSLVLLDLEKSVPF